MSKYIGHNTIGSLPVDGNVCAVLTSKNGTALAEAYVYMPGFFRFNWHPSMELMFVLKGSLKAYTEHGTYLLSENDFILIQPNVGHASIHQSPGTVAAVLHVSQHYLESICNFFPQFSCTYTGADTYDEDYFRIRRAFAAFYRLLSTSNELGSRICAESELLAIIGTLIMHFSVERDNVSASVMSEKQRKILSIMLDHIHRNFKSDITLKELADLTGMNVSYISNFFKTHVRINFHEYLTRKRLENAIWMLNNTDDSILNIAVEAGFPDAKAFYTAFKKYFGITPKVYRCSTLRHPDAYSRNIVPTRLVFTDPVVLEKIEEYTA